ncbi:MAG: hypothetical protein LC100_14945 [Chitinophagales bacterium]|nr:hypothetical protein [Chitinophagales bacterium]
MQSDNRRQDDATVKVIAERIDNLHDHISDLRDSMKESMKEMANAVNKLVRIEEGQIHMMQAHERLALQLDKHEERCRTLEQRVDDLEKDQPMTKQVVSWVMWGVGSIAVAAVTFIAKAVGFM